MSWSPGGLRTQNWPADAFIGFGVSLIRVFLANGMMASRTTVISGDGDLTRIFKEHELN